MRFRELFSRDKSAGNAVVLNSSKAAVGFSLIDSSSFPFYNIETAQGLRVTKEQALAVPAVLRGRNLIAGTIATLPICTVDANNNRIRVPLLEQIDPNIPNSVTIAQTVEDLLFEGIGWWLVTARGFDGYPTSATHVDARNVTIQPPSGFPPNRLPSNYIPGSHVFVLVNSVFEAIPAADVIRFDSTNPPLLTAAARAIRRALKLELTADRYADDPRALEYFTAVDGGDPEDTEVTSFLDAWIAARQTRSTGYVPSGFERHDINAMSPADLQLAQLVDKATLSLANAMGLDPEDLGLSTTSRTYRNDVTARQNRVNDCYGPYIQAIEDRLSMGDVTKRGQSVRFDLDDYLKADPLTRMQVQTGYLAAEVITRDEIRSEEYQPPLTAAQKRELSPPPPPAPVAAPAVPDNQLPSNVTPIRKAQNYASDGATGLTFDLSDVAKSFSVNEAQRTITGVVVPWNKVGRSGGRRWKFAKDSLQFSKSQVNRIKLLNDHDQSQILGRVEKTWSDEVGQWATYKIARGPEGDKALAMAADGVKDGLSVGIGFEGDDTGFTYGPDPTDGSVILVTSAPWRETSLVAMPAFDDARVSAVTMSADHTGGNMPCSQCGQVHAEGVTTCQTTTNTPVAVTYSAEQVAAMFAALGSHQPIPPAVPEKPEEPTVVNPVRPADLAVKEAPLYRFDGGKAQRCFTSDLVAMSKGDSDAAAILQKYADTEMAALFANISPTNVATLNPVPTRPELYVPNLSYPRPLGSMVTTGPLNDLIAFIVPKYSSSSGLVADHTPGTEPSQGAFAATSQTITPKGLSGRVDLDREIIDSGGSPQADQLIYSEMVRAYNEVLEKRIVDVLQALSLSDTNTVGTNFDLQANLLTLFAGFQFNRGGDRYNSFASHSDLYSALVNAVDDDGRPLFPMVGATNADGSTASDLTSVRVGTKQVRPAWALASGNGGPDKSFLFVKESVYQWASAPRRFDFTQVNVSSVGIGIWGYSAEAVTRNSDVLQLAYSAA